MARNFRNQLAGQIGESLVVAELGRRGIIATSFAGNVPDIDVLAYRNGRTLAMQVKAWRTGSVHMDATRYLEIEIEGGIQTVVGLREDIDPDLIFAFVKVGAASGEDRFFLLTQLMLQKVIMQSYTAYLTRHGGQRPRNPQTTHNSVTLDQLLPHEGNWDLIAARLE